MEFSIIICTYNRCKCLSSVLEDIEKLVVPQDLTWEVLIVDNNSTDQTKSVIDSFIRKRPEIFRYVFEGRQGKSFALNAGVEAACGQILVFTDDDVQLDPYWLLNLKKVFDEYDCAGVAGRIVATWTCEKPGWLPTDGPYRLMDVIVQFDHGDSNRELRKLPYGANMAFRRGMFEKYGLFRLDLGPRPGSKIYHEDTEFGLRVKNGGEKLLYAPEAVVYHPVEESRVTKEYYQSWYFGFGGALMRTNGLPQDAVLYFGIPRYFFRNLAMATIHWMFAMDAQERFYHKLNVYLVAGTIAEAFKLSREIGAIR
jgi:glucosyl-dolichyl phosphate glucuronosyltransferase